MICEFMSVSFQFVSETVDVVVRLIRDAWNGRQDRGSGSEGDWLKAPENNKNNRETICERNRSLRNYPRERYRGLRARNVYP